MKDFSFGKYNSIMLFSVLYSGTIQMNARTGHRVKVLPGGASFFVDMRAGLLPLVENRKTFPTTAAAEVAWSIQGSRDVTWLQQYAHVWDKFTESDGKTIKNAYGYRWRRYFGRDQLGDAIATLKADSSNRQVVISAWDPAHDGLLTKGEKNVPCPAMFTFSIIGDYLHSSLFLRSSDIFVGLPYDVMGHALLMEAVRQSLAPTHVSTEDTSALKLGSMTVTIAHGHVYEDHWEMARESLLIDPMYPRIKMPTYSVEEIEENPEQYVETVRKSALVDGWSPFNPKPNVVE